MTEMRHCDEYIDDHNAPQVLRDFLTYARRAGHGFGLDEKVLWATVKPDLLEPTAKFLRDKGIAPGQRVRVCMASRFGDVGINTDGKPHGYNARVAVEHLTDFAATRDAPPSGPQIVISDEMVERGAMALYRFATEMDAGLPVWGRNQLTASLYRSRVRAVLAAALNGGAA
jgi:hypothetical protein